MAMPSVTTRVALVAKLLSAASQFYLVRSLIILLGLDLYASFALINSLSLWMSLGDLGLGIAVQNKLGSLPGNSNSTNISIILQLISKLQLGLLIFFVPVLVIVVQIAIQVLDVYPGQHSSGFFLCLLLSNSMWAIVAILSVAFKVFYGLHRGYWANIYPAAGNCLSLTVLLLLMPFVGGLESRYLLIAAVLVCSVPQVLVALIAIIHLRFSPFSRENLSQAGSSSGLVNGENPGFNLRQIARESLGFWVFSLMGLFILNSDYVVMSILFRPEEIVEYKIVGSLFAFVYALCYASLMSLWPRSSRLVAVSNFPPIYKSIRQNIAWGGAALSVFSVVLISGRTLIARFMSDGQVVISAGLVLSFAFLYLIRISGDAFAVALAGAGRSGIFVAYMPVQLIISLVLQFQLGGLLGPMGVACGIALSFLFTAFWINPLALFKLRQRCDVAKNMS